MQTGPESFNTSEGISLIFLLLTDCLRLILGEELGGVGLRDLKSSIWSADPDHVDLIAFFIPAVLDIIKLLIARALLLFLNDAVLVKESSSDLPDTEIKTLVY